MSVPSTESVGQPGTLSPIAAAVSGNRAKTAHATVPAALADVQLIDGPTCAAAAAISVSQWHELVRIGRAPQPAFRAPRCTRWKLADVRRFLIEFAQQGEGQAAARHVVVKARRASAIAHSKRQRGSAAQVGA